MLLILNIGNSNTSAGIFDADTIVASGFRPTTDLAYQSSMQEFTQSLLVAAGIKRDTIEGCVLSSVVPAQTTLWTSFLRDGFACTPVVVSTKMSTGIRIDYDNPGTLGADRFCACIAAHKLYGGPALVIDFGTATTYNLIDGDGNFLGGAIAPGIMTAARSLHRNTAQLPEIPFTPPAHFPGKSTRECLEAGIFYAGTDAAKGMIFRSLELLGSSAKVVATGGLSETLKEHIPEIDVVDQNLVLKGAFILFRQNT